MNSDIALRHQRQILPTLAINQRHDIRVTTKARTLNSQRVKHYEVKVLAAEFILGIRLLVVGFECKAHNLALALCLAQLEGDILCFAQPVSA